VAGRYLGNVLLFQGATLDDVHTARLLLEPSAVAALAGKLTEDQLAELRALGAAGHAETDAARRRAVGGPFHTALVRTTGNPVLSLFADLINDLIDAQAARVQNQRVQAREPSRSEELLDSHDRLLALLQAGAAQEAARMWRDHLEEVHTLLSTSVDTT